MTREVEHTEDGRWVQLAKTGLGERGTAWWEQDDAERRTRWETALRALDT
ncbi:hypothetical protein O2V63_01765 [Modestobacter sp. VKM Ac-2977]|nr:hypothetical protein [Modestobacter sp. VKM Ac-2977]MCZ2819055.1 hypothetical protein [Modestobacter sp. VKM Ac-2977]